MCSFLEILKRDKHLFSVKRDQDRIILSDYIEVMSRDLSKEGREGTKMKREL